MSQPQAIKGKAIVLPTKGSPQPGLNPHPYCRNPSWFSCTLPHFLEVKQIKSINLLQIEKKDKNNKEGMLYLYNNFVGPNGQKQNLIFFTDD